MRRFVEGNRCVVQRISRRRPKINFTLKAVPLQEGLTNAHAPQFSLPEGTQGNYL